MPHSKIALRYYLALCFVYGTFYHVSKTPIDRFFSSVLRARVKFVSRTEHSFIGTWSTARELSDEIQPALLSFPSSIMGVLGELLFLVFFYVDCCTFYDQVTRPFVT